MKRIVILSSLMAFLAGLGTSYWLWPARDARFVYSSAQAQTQAVDYEELMHQINPPEGVTLPARFGSVGPALVDAGAIDLAAFASVFQRAGQPLTEEQWAILQEGSTDSIVINRQNAYFLLNFLWALGLTNQNRILTEGPMMQNGPSEVGRFASTGGWTLGTRDPASLYASASILNLSPNQQARVEEAAAMIYRPCCSNPTMFPDCNHGMAMLGLLELMASQDASLSEMLIAAKYVNAFWFPEQTMQVALYYKAGDGLDFPELDPRDVVGVDFMSGYGSQQVRLWLDGRGLLDTGRQGDSGCGV